MAKCKLGMVLAVAGIAAFFSIYASGAEEITESIEGLDLLGKITGPLEADLLEKNIELDFFGNVIQGFDNNVFLDPSRTRDAYIDTGLYADLTYHRTEDLRFNFDSNATNVAYYRFNDNNLLDIEISPGFEMDLFDDQLTFEANYELDWIFFPYDEDGTYLSNGMSFFLKNRISDDISHKVGFTTAFKDYTDRKTYGSDGAQNSNLREDIRYTAEYEIAAYIGDMLKLRQRFRYFDNDSNNQFQDYYDYIGFNSRTSLIAFLTQRMYYITSFSYTRRDYDDRISSNLGVKQKDHLYIFNVSMLYDLSDAYTLTAGYSYRENVSNEALDKYSGSAVTIGLYYSF